MSENINSRPELLSGFEFPDAHGNEFKIDLLSAVESEGILEASEVHGDEYGSIENLKTNGLAPYVLVHSNGQRPFAVSKPFEVAGKRKALVGYVEQDNGIFVARGFYLSNSHGIFKYLPSYLSIEGRIRLFDKGFGETSISLAYPMQRAISAVLEDTPLIQTFDDPTTTFISTARSLTRDYKKPTTYQRMVKKDADALLETPDGVSLGERIPPENVDIPAERYPDFDHEVNSWMQTSPLYGEINLTTFPSLDGTLLFTFAADSLGRAWIANIEPDSKYNSMGIHDSHIFAHSLTTPAYDYADSAWEYGNDSMRSGQYIDMFEKYLSKIKLIQKFLLYVRSKDTTEFQVQVA